MKTIIAASLALVAIAAGVVLTFAASGDSGNSRRQYAESLNLAGSTITYTTEAYQDRVLVVTEREGDAQEGRDMLNYLNGQDDVRARGFLSINYRVSAESAEGDEVWVWIDLSRATKGCAP
jgi:hypothetical protein